MPLMILSFMASKVGGRETMAMALYQPKDEGEQRERETEREKVETQVSKRKRNGREFEERKQGFNRSQVPPPSSSLSPPFEGVCT